jgi:uncharacterized membrane protein
MANVAGLVSEVGVLGAVTGAIAAWFDVLVDLCGGLPARNVPRFQQMGAEDATSAP